MHIFTRIFICQVKASFFKVFRLLVCFSFFIVLPFFFRQDELVIFYIARAFALAFRIIHAVHYMIGFPFYHDHHLNINMALYSPLYEAENRTKFTDNHADKTILLYLIKTLIFTYV